LLLRNDQRFGHHWLRLKLVGTRSNRDAIGAWIKVRVGGQTLSRQVMPTRSYLSQSELPVTWPGRLRWSRPLRFLGWRHETKVSPQPGGSRHNRAAIMVFNQISFS
jgi:hypothetical protein